MKASRARALGFGLALAGVAAVVFVGVRAVMTPPPDDLGDVDYGEDDPDAADLARGERFEEVRSLTRDVYETFPGRIAATGIIPVTVPQGMRVAVTKIEAEVGHTVAKGEVLMRFNKPAVVKAIEDAEKAGDKASADRFRSYLPFCDLKSPADGVVYEIKKTLGEVPVDAGDTAVMTLVDPASFALRVQVPTAVTSTVAHLGAKLSAVLEGTNGTVTGTVSALEPAPEGWVVVVLAIDPHEGLEENMTASLRIPTSKVEVALVPKSAVTLREGVKVVRVWEASDKMIGERTILTDGAEGDDWIVTAGVVPGESVVVPEPSRAR